ncbi:ferrous iron transport protein B [Sporobacter termitidis DSM 10068]|uniref:Ferrous iron transport protein B n=1 Tax=Sporobacter termitidis DSM 10068 TaxID=1123282 RepID=A0A1M5VAQ3_9FIRM|nr:ferrous iron transport protein B [Sporobacter termitidis]SHH72329.1 ferrous iron transport protein B [Sporobacter termitidis DSM 10068]
MTAAEKTLQGLYPGQTGIILSVGNQSGAVKRRLVDMGLTPGTAVTVKRIAPFGDPIEVRLRGYELSLRRDDAAQIVLGDLPPRRRDKISSRISYDTRRPDPETLRRMRYARAAERGVRAAAYESDRDDGSRTIALVGNPNSGKTTLYNALTGSSQSVGNWPGVTVEKKEGAAKLGGGEIRIIDLPGVYSLSPYSMEEIVTRDCILGTADSGRPDAVINIVDATNIERNLYLTVQLLELERPMVLALNFMDEARKNGDTIDTARLAEALGVPVVPISAKTGENIDALLRAADRQTRRGYTLEPDGLYDGMTRDILGRIGRLVRQPAEAAGIPVHWAAVKLLEGDNVVLETLDPDGDARAAIEDLADEYAASGPGDRETLIADSRYRYIEKTVRDAVRKGPARRAETVTDRIDKIVTHRILAAPVFLLLMLVMFALTFGPPGKTLSDGVAFIIGNFSGWLRTALAGMGTAPWLISLLTDGVIAGVGGVLNFLPQIALLFFCLSLLEDSGYMARAAFITDRLLRRFGLSGKAFIPMLMGFGCSVPAVMGARTMESDKDRKMTIMLVPFMSCSAKLPVYGLLSAAFFGAWAGIVVFSLYLLGMAMAVASGIFFRRTIFAGEPAPFVMELPPYRLPTLGNALVHVWDRVKSFLVRAGTLIFLMSVVLWFLRNFNGRLQLVADSADGILAGIGAFIAPVFRPMGFGVWQASVALLTGLIAKEAVVASLSMLYGFSLTAGGLAVASAMTGFTPLAAYAYLVFILLYIPCVAAVSTICREMNSLKWTALSAAWQLFVAYVTSMAVYQIGRLFGL